MKRNNFVIAALFLILFMFSSWHTEPLDQKAVTWHSFFLDGKLIDYKATAGYIPLTDGNGIPVAKIFYTAYTSLNAKTEQRPLTFVFNGGPGSASLWLHMGSFAPVRVKFKTERGDPAAAGSPYQDNPNSWLGFTDLVFIDPVSTGYSRAAAGIDPKRFYGYDQDIRSIADFIQSYLVQNNRLESSVFMVGESYGAARAVGLTQYLQKQQVRVSGITLISPALNYQLLNFDHQNDQPYIYYLPTYAVTAQYHHRLAPSLQNLTKEELFKQASFFATHTYAGYLSHRRTTAEMPKEIVDSLASFTGLSRKVIIRYKGKIRDNDFMKELLLPKDEWVGCFDSRFTGPEKGGGYVDPSETNIRSLFIPAFDSYMHRSLAYANSLLYLATITVPWNYGTAQTNGYLNVSHALRSVITNYPELKVNVICGYYDLATPLSATECALSHIGLPEGLQKHIKLNCYDSGHMVYISEAANIKLQANSKKFYEEALYDLNTRSKLSAQLR